MKRRPVPARPKSSSRSARADSRLTKIYEIVRAIPRGKVATYGEIAELAGIPAGHRVAARALRVCPPKLPWQRVVGKKDTRRATINIEDEAHADLQRRLLEAEGVTFDANGFILLRRSGWLHAPAERGRKRRSTT